MTESSREGFPHTEMEPRPREVSFVSAEELRAFSHNDLSIGRLIKGKSLPAVLAIALGGALFSSEGRAGSVQEDFVSAPTIEASHEEEGFAQTVRAYIDEMRGDADLREGLTKPERLELALHTLETFPMASVMPALASLAGLSEVELMQLNQLGGVRLYTNSWVENKLSSLGPEFIHRVENVAGFVLEGAQNVLINLEMIDKVSKTDERFVQNMREALMHEIIHTWKLSKQDSARKEALIEGITQLIAMDVLRSCDATEIRDTGYHFGQKQAAALLVAALGRSNVYRDILQGDWPAIEQAASRYFGEEIWLRMMNDPLPLSVGEVSPLHAMEGLYAWTQTLDPDVLDPLILEANKDLTYGRIIFVHKKDENDTVVEGVFIRDERLQSPEFNGFVNGLAIYRLGTSKDITGFFIFNPAVTPPGTVSRPVQSQGLSAAICAYSPPSFLSYPADSDFWVDDAVVSEELANNLLAFGKWLMVDEPTQ